MQLTKTLLAGSTDRRNNCWTDSNILPQQQMLHFNVRRSNRTIYAGKHLKKSGAVTGKKRRWCVSVPPQTQCVRCTMYGGQSHDVVDCTLTCTWLATQGLQCTPRSKGLSSHGPECVCYMVHAYSSYGPVRGRLIRLCGSGCAHNFALGPLILCSCIYSLLGLLSIHGKMTLFTCTSISSWPYCHRCTHQHTRTLIAVEDALRLSTYHALVISIYKFTIPPPILIVQGISRQT